MAFLEVYTCSRLNYGVSGSDLRLTVSKISFASAYSSVVPCIHTSTCPAYERPCTSLCINSVHVRCTFVFLSKPLGGLLDVGVDGSCTSGYKSKSNQSGANRMCESLPIYTPIICSNQLVLVSHCVTRPFSSLETDWHAPVRSCHIEAFRRHASVVMIGIHNQTGLSYWYAPPVQIPFFATPTIRSTWLNRAAAQLISGY